MMINEAHAQATAASGRGDGQYPSGLHDGAEISTAAGGQTKAEVPLTMGSGDNERKPDAGLSARGGKQRCVGVETVAEEELAQRMAGID